MKTDLQRRLKMHKKIKNCDNCTQKTLTSKNWRCTFLRKKVDPNNKKCGENCRHHAGNCFPVED